MPLSTSVRSLFVAALAGLSLSVAATGGSAATVTFGSPLTAEPNYGLGCESKPTVSWNDLDTLVPTSSGQPSCTWYQLGEFGSLADTRRGHAPGEGRITSVTIRSGANPAPLRVVVFRQISATGPNAPLTGTTCCTFRARSEELRPTPGATSTFAVDLPVESFRDIDARTQVDDIVGISAVSGTGTLPIFVDPARARASFLTSPGTLTAAGWWPAIGDRPGDTGAGRSNDTPAGVGFELLARFTFCGTVGVGVRSAQAAVRGERQARARQAGCGADGGGGGAGGGGAGGGGAAGGGTAAAPVRLGLTAPRQRLRDARRARALRLTCTLDVAGACAATATVTPATARRLRLRVPRKATAVRIGTGRVTVRRAGKATLRIPLGASVRRALGRSRQAVSVRVAVTASAAGRATASSTRTLRLRR